MCVHEPLALFEALTLTPGEQLAVITLGRLPIRRCRFLNYLVVGEAAPILPANSQHSSLTRRHSISLLGLPTRHLFFYLFIKQINNIIYLLANEFYAITILYLVFNIY